MLRILTWNIQSGLGCDGIRAISRIVERIESLGSPQIICLQEVSRFFSEYSTPGEEDQVRILCAAFPEYLPVWGPGMRWRTNDTEPMEFGNLTLVKEGLLDQRIHPLPRPPGAGKKQMPRSAVESVIETPLGVLTLINTHIAYHNRQEQQLQLAYLNQFQVWQEENWSKPVLQGTGAYEDRNRAIDTIICGDLNIEPESFSYQDMIVKGWYDCFNIVHPGKDRAPTCGVHGEQWKQGPHCRDYFLVSGSLPPYVADLQVDESCDYSDHQPVVVSLDVKKRK